MLHSPDQREHGKGMTVQLVNPEELEACGTVPLSVLNTPGFKYLLRARLPAQSFATLHIIHGPIDHIISESVAVRYMKNFRPCVAEVFRHEIEIHDGEDGVDIDFDLEPVED